MAFLRLPYRERKRAADEKARRIGKQSDELRERIGAIARTDDPFDSLAREIRSGLTRKPRP